MLESTQVQELNGLITTTITAPYSQELERAFYVGSRDVDDNGIFWMYKVDKRSKENSNIVINGTYTLFDDLKAYDIIRDKRPKNQSTTVAINAILEGSRWQLGSNTSGNLGTANWYYVSRLEAFWEFLENWNVEFKPRMTFSQGQITGRYIDIVGKLSGDYGKWYEYGDKILDIKAEQSSDSLYTAFIGRGKGVEVAGKTPSTDPAYGRRLGFDKIVWTTANGKPVNKPLNQDFVEIPSATAQYGYSDGKPRTTVVIFEDTEDAAQLLQQTYDYALNECRPKLQLRADVLETQLSELGETCTIVRDDIGIRYKTRVFKLTRNFLNKNQKTVEFGDDIVQSTAQRNNGVVKTIKKQDNKIIDWLNNLRNQVIDTYFNEDGYNYDLAADNEYDLPAGYYSFDRPMDASPTKVIYMGAGKLLIANSKLPNGQWDWTTAIDGNGANLDAVNTGVLQAGRIQSFGRDSYWDLDNDNIYLKEGTIEASTIRGSEIFGTVIKQDDYSNVNNTIVQIDKNGGWFADVLGKYTVRINREGIVVAGSEASSGGTRISNNGIFAVKLNIHDIISTGQTTVEYFTANQQAVFQNGLRFAGNTPPTNARTIFVGTIDNETRLWLRPFSNSTVWQGVLTKSDIDWIRDNL